jgi:undecaprenyl-diphosphatase
VAHRAGWLDPVFIGLSVVGYAGLVWVALAAAVAFFRGRPLLPAMAFTAACVWSADLLALAFKSATGRPRPYEALPQVDPLMGATVGQSLPSGHAATSFAAAVLLTSLWPRAWPGFFLLATAIAFSRVYVGVHYPSDVLAGAALGAVVGLAWVAALRLPRMIGAARRRSGGAPPAG